MPHGIIDWRRLKASSGNIHQNCTKANWHQKQRFKTFADSQKQQNQTHSHHNHLTELHLGKARTGP